MPRGNTAKFACPRCGEYASTVVNVRQIAREDGVWRRRECLTCHRRFTTRESMDFSAERRQYKPKPSQ